MPSYTTPPTFTAGATLTHGNAQILSDDIAALAGKPTARKYRTGALTATNDSAFHAIAFDGTSTGFYDSHTGFSGGTYTIAVAGYYRFRGAFLVAPTGAGQRLAIAVYKNGAEIARGDDYLTEASGFGSAVVGDANVFALNDTVTWQYRIGAALVFQTGAALTYGSITLERFL